MHFNFSNWFLDNQPCGFGLIIKESISLNWANIIFFVYVVEFVKIWSPKQLYGDDLSQIDYVLMRQV